MSDMFSGDIMNVDSLQISTIFEFMNPEYHEAVVKRALNSRKIKCQKKAGVAQLGYTRVHKS